MNRFYWTVCLKAVSKQQPHNHSFKLLTLSDFRFLHPLSTWSVGLMLSYFIRTACHFLDKPSVFVCFCTKITLVSFHNRARVFRASARREWWDAAMDPQADAGEVRQPEPGSASSRWVIPPYLNWCHRSLRVRIADCLPHSAVIHCLVDDGIYLLTGEGRTRPEISASSQQVI